MKLKSSKSEITMLGDYSDSPTENVHISRLTFVFLGVSLILHIADVGIDYYITVSYYCTHQYLYFYLTLTFVVVPAVIIALLSIRMYVDDSNDNEEGFTKPTIVRMVLCVVGLPLQLAPFIRYYDSLYYAKKVNTTLDKPRKNTYYNKMLFENSDVAFLKLVECYTETSFQQVIQLTLLLVDYSYGSNDNIVRQIISLSFGFIGMGVSMATYQRAIRYDEETANKISIKGLIFLFLWHSNFTVSRIFALTAAATLYPMWTTLALLLHWLGMTVWLALTRKTNFCGENRTYEICFSGVIGMIYVFNFITVKDGPTRKTYITFYLLYFFENAFAILIWGIYAYSYFKDFVYYTVIILTVVTFSVALICALAYYKYFHPTKK